MGGGVSTNHKSSNRIELSQLGQLDPPMGGGVSTNHKSSNRIELSRLLQDLLNF